MNATATSARPGGLTQDQMLGQLAASPDYRVPVGASAARFADAAHALFGGKLQPLMASAGAAGRFAGAALGCPATACTGTITLSAGAQSKIWRNPEAIECIFCAEGSLVVRYGPDLAGSVRLGRFDMFSVPANVRIQVRNAGKEAARTINVLSVAPGAGYDAVFESAASRDVPADACGGLGVRFDDQRGDELDSTVAEGRVTRFETLVPYKKDLNRTGGLPPEATESLSAGNVFPLIVPEGHIGRSRTAPMYGNQGLYISIAECKVGTDGPPPHAHSDTQESFYVLDGTFDICTGFESETSVAVKPHDLLAVPNKVMRTFRNTTGRPARLLVIIQGPDKMSDTVSFSSRIGEDFKKRFGADIIEKYAAIRMTFDAEQRAGL